MTDLPLPHQPTPSDRGGGGDDVRNGRPPVHPALSEAGRMLCAGTYLDAAYRDKVIDELYVHEERIVAPSYGFDAARVLAHALRARRAELGWAAGILGAWFVGMILTGGALLGLLVPFVLLSLSGWLRAHDNRLVRFLGVVLRIYTWLLLLLLVIGLIGVGLAAGNAFGPLGVFGADTFLSGFSGSVTGSGDPYSSGYDSYASSASSGSSGLGAAAALWWVLAVFLAMVALVWFQRGQAARAIAGELSPRRYADLAGDPAEAAQGVRFARIRGRVRAEQHNPLIMYNVNDPFCGAGDPYRPWHLSVELRPREDLGPDRKAVPVTNSDIVRRIVPLVQALRVPSPHGSPAAEAAVLDRMRELVVDECVFLPGGGLPHRNAVPLTPDAWAEHLGGALEEGGERRRHFLRIRVGGWDENLVVTVFVRVHTQGGMMMLEVAPHVLLPLRTVFQNADADAHRYLHNNWLGKAAWALRHTPASFVSSVAILGRGIASWWRILTGGHGGALPEGPGLSVRELASQDNGSLFHLMDLDRYLKTIQDRVVSGVTLALHEAGWHTEEFAQRAITVAEGGTYIQSVNNSAFSVGGSGHTNTTNHSGRRRSSGGHQR
ncbi:hypothetical protein OHS33_22110 [Streptomyces sp. NBC_00536]|uniref:hypothetical protein n=1 Tax=Streptomyces sp. NBC_00536 TaxID=2975769 RepID=UPI002E80D7E2|nr:hypothetical protein [Streptomyces sp. NBC_00536]WUC80788.1 hypothetical protein OHS33_22110 [Streptomyces sp. NBC_00536]